MKKKRFLGFALTLAILLGIIPAKNLNASAAEITPSATSGTMTISLVIEEKPASGSSSGSSSGSIAPVIATPSTVAYQSLPVAAGSVTDVTGSVQATGETNPYSAKIVNSGDLEKALGITAEEKAQGVNVWLDVKSTNSTISAKNKKLIKQAKGDYELGRYVTVNIYKKVGNGAAEKITKTNKKVNVQIKVPKKLRSSDRDYAIVRVANGKTKLVKGAYNAKKKTLTIKVSKFSSSCAIVYKDKK